VQLFHDQRENDAYQPAVKIRPGAIVPLGRIVQNTTENSLDPLTLLVNLDASGQATGSLYDDAGEGFAYKSGAFFQVTFQAKKQGSTVHITVTHKSGHLPLPEKTTALLITDQGAPLRATGNIATGLTVDFQP
jgi:alpha-glucosidase